jgi:RNA polymerase sigma factor (sigma-70 family)
MRLAEHLDDVQETASLGAWLATTARREAIRVSRLGSRQVPVDPWEWLQREDEALEAPETGLLATERRLSVQLAVAELPERCRRLLLALAADPPASYVEISTGLNLPMGSIGPTRSRCLQRLAQLLEQLDAAYQTEEYSERSPR